MFFFIVYYRSFSALVQRSVLSSRKIIYLNQNNTIISIYSIMLNSKTIMKKRPHYDVIIAWANGAEVEIYDTYDRKWKSTMLPAFLEEKEYRVKFVDLVVGQEYRHDHETTYIYIGPLGRDKVVFEVKSFRSSFIRWYFKHQESIMNLVPI